MKEQGEYPVIYLTFKNVKELKQKVCLQNISSEILRAYENYEFIYEKLNLMDKELFKEVQMMRSNIGVLSESLLYLYKDAR